MKFSGRSLRFCGRCLFLVQGTHRGFWEKTRDKNACLDSCATEQCSFHPWLVVWYRGYPGWQTTQLYGDYFISQYKDPYKPIRIQWNVIRVLNAAQLENFVDLSYSTHEFEKAKDQGDAVNGKRARRNLLRWTFPWSNLSFNLENLWEARKVCFKKSLGDLQCYAAPGTYASIFNWKGNSHARGKSKKKGFVSTKPCQLQKTHIQGLSFPEWCEQNSTSGMYFGRNSQTPGTLTFPPFFLGILPPNQPTDRSFPLPKLRQLYVGCTKKLTVKRKVVDTSEAAPRSGRWWCHWIRGTETQLFARFFQPFFFAWDFTTLVGGYLSKIFFGNFHPYLYLGEMIQSDDVFFETGTFFFKLPTSKKKGEKFRRILEWQDSTMVVLGTMSSCTVSWGQCFIAFNRWVVEFPRTVFVDIH